MRNSLFNRLTEVCTIGGEYEKHIRKFESKAEQAANAHKLTTPTTFAIMAESLSCLEAIKSRSRSVTKRSSEIADLGVSKRQQRKTSPNKLWDIEVLDERVKIHYRG